MNVQIWILFLLNFNGATSLSSHKWQDSDFLGIFLLIVQKHMLWGSGLLYLS